MSKKAKSTTRNYDAFPDRVDIRDWFYQPTLLPLPDEIINIGKVPFVINQGSEGACTGFALAAVINFHLSQKIKGFRENQKQLEVSPRMLYEMARKYDEWPGENYDGSSARGTIKGWTAHGVCRRTLWNDKTHGTKYFSYDLAEKANEVPGGAYYRVMHKQVRDMHAALSESGILFATSMVHDGWDEPVKEAAIPVEYVDGKEKKIMKLPVIVQDGKAEDGHAFAIVGYTKDGFIIQNSWGARWGNKGFALLPYDDWMQHATDCWVAQLGVPINSEAMNIPVKKGRRTVLVRSSQTVPLKDIRAHVVDIGNNGKLSQTGEYWTTEEDIQFMFEAIAEKTESWKKKRLLLYLHGGLNAEKEVARRIVAFRDIMMGNEIYPVHIMWETGVWESLKSSVFDLFSKEDERAGASWWDKLRDTVSEVKDRTFELTTSAAGTALWDEMKENAALASERSEGGMKLLCEKAIDAFDRAKIDLKDWELHVIAHSAGSIFTAYGLPHLLKLHQKGLKLTSIHFMAPAITTELFKEKMLDEINKKECPIPQLFILNDSIERADSVGPYGKSLLYLVSNAFEDKRETPILGMEKFVNTQLKKLYQGKDVNGFEKMVLADKSKSKTTAIDGNTSCSDSHGGFDNDPHTLNSILMRILGKRPLVSFKKDNLNY